MTATPATIPYQEAPLFSLAGLEPVPTLPAVECLDCTGPVLQKVRWTADPDLLCLNYLGGSARRWSLYPSRATAAEEDAVTLQVGVAEQLAIELSLRETLPRAVLLCPGSDPFAPLRGVQEETAQVIEVLAQRGIQSWLQTRGYIRPAALTVLARHASLLRLTLALTTLDRPLQRALEPLSAPPRMRLRQFRHLQSLGVPVQMALEPLLPGVTDHRSNLAELFAALAEAGVRQVSTGHLFLPLGQDEHWRERLHPAGVEETVLAEYSSGQVQTIPGVGPCRLLSRRRRQDTYATMMVLAARHNIRLSISAWSNPDFTRR